MQHRVGALREGYAAMFGAAGMAAALHDDHCVRGESRERECLTGLRRYGTGYRLGFRDEGGADDAV